MRRLWDMVDPADTIAARAFVEEALPPIVHKYGDIGVSVAADFYETLRSEAGVPGPFRPIAPRPLPDEQILASGRWAIGPTFQGDPRNSINRLVQALHRLSGQQGKDTIFASVAGDPSKPRWARVPTGSETCAFCLMLASRGAVYWSERTAGGMDATQFHANDDCIATPMWDGDPYPSGYDPDALYKKYDRAAEKVHGTGGGTKDILSVLREQEGLSS